MRSETIPTVSSLLSSCAHPSHLPQAHARILTLGLHRRIPTIVSAATLGLLDSALLLFHFVRSPSPFLFNMAIRACAAGGRFHVALSLYSTLLYSVLRPDKFTIPYALRSCAALSDLRLGKLLHQHSLCFRCSSDLFVAAALVDMYSKCGDVFCAWQMFDKMASRDFGLLDIDDLWVRSQ
ncbi:hypothetical protein OPV22_015689 [Ensete ventricosum]|uniref:Pentacotripeptide-repeat region of PRORP domain-containing protein n=1 Tax=Ensete ventricosum TaxID=4639 RepID=A0AAV8R626_ENSVE|nr:hypothetical protein OPV22_015689 [Ensete ventricosum]